MHPFALVLAALLAVSCAESSHASHKIFGVGLSKTGSTSLGAALEEVCRGFPRVNRAYLYFSSFDVQVLTDKSSLGLSVRTMNEDQHESPLLLDCSRAHSI